MNRTINIAICEDNEQQLQINKYYIEQWAESEKQSVRLLTYKNAESFLFEWEYEANIDIIFLDIRMGEMTGMELAQYICKKNHNIDIIFITGEEQYILQGYQVQAFNFLLKPVKKEDMFESLDTWVIRNKNKDGNHLVIKKGKKILKLNYEEIYYLISFDHYIDVHTKEGVVTFKQKIGEVEQQLPQKQFCRCHRSYIVNLKYVNQIFRNEIILENDIKIPIKNHNLSLFRVTLLTIISYCGVLQRIPHRADTY